MDTQPDVQRPEARPWHAIPKEERDAMLRAAGIRPASSKGPLPHFEAIRIPKTLRWWYFRIFPDGLHIPRPRFLRRLRKRTRVPAAQPEGNADARPWHTRPKEERDAILRAAGIEPARIGGPLPYLKPVRTRTTLRLLWQRMFAD